MPPRARKQRAAWHDIKSIKARVARLSGRKRNLVAFLCGVCATAAMAPFFVFPLLVPSFCGLLWLVTSAPTPRRAFFDGWWWGFGFFTTGLYWICIAMLVDPWKFGWLIPFTEVGLNGVVALYPALAALGFYMLRLRRGVAMVLVFAAVWTLAEYARGHLLTGFPWNLIGYAWSGYDSAMQPAAWIGVYGLSFLTVIAAAMPASGSRRATLAAWVLFALMVAGGAWRLHDAVDENVPGVRLRIVQANVGEHEKWDPAMEEKSLETYMRLTQSAGFSQVTHVIWPETAVPYALNHNASLVNLLRLAVPAEGMLVTGTIRVQGEGAGLHAWNSMAFISPRGNIRYYDKHHLVPFGEFVPFRNILPLDRIAPGPTDFSAGPGPRSVPFARGIMASPLICYEVIFPGEVARALPRPSLLLNITNDAWFGNSTGPYQHFYMAKMRAVEEGLPLVRAANTGISGVTDAYGRVQARLPLLTQGVLDAALPHALRGGTTYSRVKDRYLLLLICFIVLVTFIYQNKRFFKS